MLLQAVPGFQGFRVRVGESDGQESGKGHWGNGYHNEFEVPERGSHLLLLNIHVRVT